MEIDVVFWSEFPSTTHHHHLWLWFAYLLADLGAVQSLGCALARFLLDDRDVTYVYCIGIQEPMKGILIMVE